ncbi:MAG TPA: methyltransferase [Syntrophales bacterium]|nr:methyltransferase [Syntrophales bacterium]
MDTPAWSPGKLIGESGHYWRSFTIHAAVNLGIFTIIGGEVLGSDEIARRLDAKGRGVAMLLNALSAMNLLVKNGERYSNTPSGRALLSKDSPEYIGHIIMHHHHLALSWLKLNEAVKTGSPMRTRSSGSDEEARESFLMGMFNIASNLAPRLVNTIDLSGRSRLLDLGGGPGTYAIYFCLNNPDLKASVYDLPTSETYARKTIEKFGLADRIDFVAGDYLKDDIPGKYDVAWLSQILHAEGPEECEKIVAKAASVLKPGGLLLIHEFILDDGRNSPLHAALFSLNMLLGTSSGRSYTEGEIKEMLARAGAKEIKRITPQYPMESGIIAGVV